jgi:hypothetical protein
MGPARIEGVLAENANATWPDIVCWAEDALKYADGLYDLEDLREGIALRDMQLWLIKQPELRAFCITEISVFPKARVLTAVLVGGEGMPEWIGALNAHLTRFGRAHECVKFNAYGRPGWRPFARGLGWSETVTYWKDLADE